MNNLQALALMIKERNEVEARISAITGRPASIGHLGEYIASQIFGLKLSESANHKAIDGWFESGPLVGRSVNVKWYAKHEGLLDICVDPGPDYYLVLAGPHSAATRATGARPWLIESVYLIEDSLLRKVVTSKIGIATSIRREIWQRHEIYPNQNPEVLSLSVAQRTALAKFGPI